MDYQRHTDTDAWQKETDNPPFDPGEFAALQKKYRMVSLLLVGVVLLAVCALAFKLFVRPASLESQDSAASFDQLITGQETEKKNRLMEYHNAAGCPLFNNPQWMDIPIYSYTFRATLDGAPSDAWDVSQDQDRSVLAWVERNAQYQDMMDMIIAADGIITAPQNCSAMFLNENVTCAIRFNGCLDTSEVTDMSDMFGCCRFLTELDLTSFDTSKVTNMSGMFLQCFSLKELDLRSFDTSNVTDMRNMFSLCLELESILVDKFDMSSVTSQENMFASCPMLDLGSSAIKTNQLKSHLSGEFLFDMSWYPSTVTFRSSLAGAPQQTCDVSEWQDGSVLAWMEDYALIIAADGTIKAPTDCGGMFADLECLTAIHFNGCLDTSMVTNMSSMFAGSSSLTYLDLSSFDTSNVRDMSYMFEWCEWLKAVDLSSFDTANVEDMTAMFGACYSMDQLDISSFDTARVKKVERMFWCCSALKNLQVSVLNMSNVTSSEDMFGLCQALDTGKISFLPENWVWDKGE